MIAHDVPWTDYHAMPEMNGSTLAHIFDSPKQLKYVIDNGYKPKTDTLVGSALHHIVEYLPIDKFDAHFCVEPDFAKSPDNVDAKGNPSASGNTKWVREQKEAFAAGEVREVLTHKQYRRIVRMLRAIQANPEAMQLVRDTEPRNREVNVSGTINDVPMRGRVDGIVPGFIQWNLKTSRQIAPKRFGWTCRDLHYLFKDAIHLILLNQNGVDIRQFRYLVVKDSVPRDDGGYNECPDCAVVPVPLIALENQFELIHEKLELYKQCMERDEWPGIGNYELYIPEPIMELTE